LAGRGSAGRGRAGQGKGFILISFQFSFFRTKEKIGEVIKNDEKNLHGSYRRELFEIQSFGKSQQENHERFAFIRGQCCGNKASATKIYFKNHVRADRQGFSDE
jgi:hypothetical protein